MRGRTYWYMSVAVLLLGRSVFALDTANYVSLRDKKLLTISKTPDKVIVATTPHFDPTTGAQLPSTVEGVSVDDLTKQKAGLQAHIDQINAVLADIAAIP